MAKTSILKNKPKVLIKQYKELLKRNNISVDKVILFGSHATGKAKPWSDLDLCIVSSDFGKNSYDEMVHLMKLAAQIEPMIEPHPYNAKDLNNPFDPLAYEIRTTGKAV